VPEEVLLKWSIARAGRDYLLKEWEEGAVAMTMWEREKARFDMVRAAFKNGGQNEASWRKEQLFHSDKAAEWEIGGTCAAQWMTDRTALAALEHEFSCGGLSDAEHQKFKRRLEASLVRQKKKGQTALSQRLQANLEVKQEAAASGKLEEAEKHAAWADGNFLAQTRTLEAQHHEVLKGRWKESSITREQWHSELTRHQAMEHWVQRVTEAYEAWKTLARRREQEEELGHDLKVPARALVACACRCRSAAASLPLPRWRSAAAAAALPLDTDH
jgi:hypothetical protein